jgi:hypothetical protein
MNLKDTKLRGIYWHAGRKQVVQLITCDPDDGASLLVEPFDEHGDIFGGDLFRCEGSELEPITREIWEQVYPSSDSENFRFEEMWPWVVEVGDVSGVGKALGVLRATHLEGKEEPAICVVAAEKENGISGEDHANARLIARAPTMSEALHRIANADIIKWDADTQEEYEREFLPWAQKLAHEALGQNDQTLATADDNQSNHDKEP